MIRLLKGIVGAIVLFTLFSFNTIKMVNVTEKYKQEIRVFLPEFKNGDIETVDYWIPQYFQLKDYETYKAINLRIISETTQAQNFDLVVKDYANDLRFYTLSPSDNLIPFIQKNLIPNTEKELLCVYIHGQVKVSKQQWESIGLKTNAGESKKVYTTHKEQEETTYSRLKSLIVDQVNKASFEQKIDLVDAFKVMIEAKCIPMNSEEVVTLQFPAKRYEGIKQDVTGLNYRTYGITYKVFDSTLNQNQNARDLDFYHVNNSQLRLDHYIKVSPTAVGQAKEWVFTFDKTESQINEMDVENPYLQLLNDYYTALNPIQLKVDQNNRIQGDVMNYSELHDKWQQTTKEIKAGDTKYGESLAIVNNKVKNAKSFASFLQEDWFYTFFFQPFYQIPSIKNTIPYQLHLSFAPGTVTAIDGQLMLAPNNTYYDTRLIQFEAKKVMDQKTYENLFHTKIAAKEVIMEVEAEWDIDDVYNMMKHMTSSIKFKVKKGKEIEVIKYISWTCYTTEESPKRVLF